LRLVNDGISASAEKASAFYWSGLTAAVLSANQDCPDDGCTAKDRSTLVFDFRQRKCGPNFPRDAVLSKVVSEFK